jgi:hypothetical protein
MIHFRTIYVALQYELVHCTKRDLGEKHILPQLVTSTDTSRLATGPHFTMPVVA